jgi:hypothetical protein
MDFDEIADRADDLRKQRKEGVELNFEAVRDPEKKRYDVFLQLELPTNTQLMGKHILEIIESALRAVGAEPIAAQAKQYMPEPYNEEATDE